MMEENNETVNPLFPSDMNQKFIEITELRKLIYANHFHIVVSFEHRWKKDPVQVLACRELKLVELVNYLRQKCEISRNESIILFCKDHLSPITEDLEEIYRKHGKDGKLKFRCMRENVFG